jgi:hypothetical protein
MSKEDKKEYTPAENVAAEDVATEDVTAEATPKQAKPGITISRKSLIGISAAAVAVALGAGFGGAALAQTLDHNGRDFRGDHSQFDQNGGQMGQQGRMGQMGGRGDHDGDGMGQMGQQGQMGQLPGDQNGQLPVPGATPSTGTGTVTPQNLPPAPPTTQSGTPQALGAQNQAPHGFTRGS